MASIDTKAIRQAFSDKLRTHYDGCELTHQFCAIARLCDEVDRLRSKLRPWAKRSQELEPEHGAYCDFVAFEEWFTSRPELSEIWDAIDDTTTAQIELYVRFCEAADFVDTPKGGA